MIAEELTKDYDGHIVFQDAHFTIEKGEKVAFVGRNGEGKSTLVKCIMGEIPYNGKLTLGYNVKIGYFAQNQASLMDESLTVFQTIDDVTPMELKHKIKDMLGAFMFSGDDIDKKVKVLSGGERTRLAMIKLLLSPVNLLILDEPTNGLDPVGIHEIRTLIRSLPQKYDCTVLVSSHLLPEVELMADDIGILNHGHLLFEGTKEELKTSARAAGFPTDNLEDTFLAMIDEDNRRRGGTV